MAICAFRRWSCVISPKPYEITSVRTLSQNERHDVSDRFCTRPKGSQQTVRGAIKPIAVALARTVPCQKQFAIDSTVVAGRPRFPSARTASGRGTRSADGDAVETARSSGGRGDPRKRYVGPKSSPSRLDMRKHRPDVTGERSYERTTPVNLNHVAVPPHVGRAAQSRQVSLVNASHVRRYRYCPAVHEIRRALGYDGYARI